MPTQTSSKKASTKGAASKVDLPAEIFDVAVNIPLIHQVVVAQQAAARQGSHSTKSRGEVRGGGRKPYKQKGTGRARQGSIRAPQFTGGGVVHGPQPRSYDQRTPKKMKAAALRGALSDRARDGRIHVVDGFGLGDAPSTKTALASLIAISDRHRFLVVLERTDAVTWLSLRNAPEVAHRGRRPAQHLRRGRLRRRGLHPGRLRRLRGWHRRRGRAPGARGRAPRPRPRSDEKVAEKKAAKKASGPKKDAEKLGRRRGRGLPRRRQGRRGRLGSRGLRDQGQRPVDEVPRPRWPLVRLDDRGVLVQDGRGRQGCRVPRGRQQGSVKATHEPRRATSEHPAQGPPRHPDRAGRLREELRPPRRQQVHVPGAPRRQQDRDQDRGREGVQRQGDRRQHAQPPGQDAADPQRAGQAQGHQARHRQPRRGPPHRHLRGRSHDDGATDECGRRKT